MWENPTIWPFCGSLLNTCRLGLDRCVLICACHPPLFLSSPSPVPSVTDLAFLRFRLKKDLIPSYILQVWVLKWRHSEQAVKWNSVKQCYSKCGLQPGSSCNTWWVIRNADSGSTPVPLNQKLCLDKWSLKSFAFNSRIPGNVGLPQKEPSPLLVFFQSNWSLGVGGADRAKQLEAHRWDIPFSSFP